MVFVFLITAFLLLLYCAPGHIQRLKKHWSSYLGIRRDTRESRDSQSTTHPRGIPQDSIWRATHDILEFERLLNHSKFFEIVERLEASSDIYDHERKNFQEFLANIRHVRPTYLNMRLNPTLSRMDRIKSLVELKTGMQWDWWPLQNPLKSNTNDSQARITWTCVSIFLITAPVPRG